MAGYQTIEALRPILHKGPPATPVLDRALFYKPRYAKSPKLHDIKRMVELRQQGLSTQKISEIVGFGRMTVRRATQHVPPPPGGWSNGSRPTQFNKEKAARMRRAGFTVAEIAEDFGCCRSRVSQMLTGWQRVYGPRKPPTPLSKVLRAVRVASGVSALAIRSTGECGKNTTKIAKARSIVFWLANKRLGISQADLARHLGGFNKNTIARGIMAAARTAETIEFSADVPIGTVTRLLWQAEWPKASA